MGKTIRICILFFVWLGTLQAGQTERARDLGVPFEGRPGPLNAITDVKGVEVGHVTLISGSGSLVIGKGPVRTGVTAVLPKGKQSNSLVFAGWFSQNGNGEMTGTTWIEESGMLEGPIMITNTHSVGVVRDAVIQWRVQQSGPDTTGYWWSLPVVAETWDGYLNDINGFHVESKHVFQAIENARTGSVEEGNVGGGTGMICHEFKGGIGTSSRLARRATLGLGRLGATSGNGSGDIFVAFSTANPGIANTEAKISVEMLSNDALSPIFEAVVQATEESIVNALVAAETMVGRDDHKVLELPHDQLKAVLKKYGRLLETDR